LPDVSMDTVEEGYSTCSWDVIDW